VSTCCAFYLSFFAGLDVADNCTAKTRADLRPNSITKKPKCALEINSYRMTAKNSYKATVERSTMRDSVHVHTVSSGKLLEQGDPES